MWRRNKGAKSEIVCFGSERGKERSKFRYSGKGEHYLIRCVVEKRAQIKNILDLKLNPDQ